MGGGVRGEGPPCAVQGRAGITHSIRVDHGLCADAEEWIPSVRIVQCWASAQKDVAYVGGRGISAAPCAKCCIHDVGGPLPPLMDTAEERNLTVEERGRSSVRFDETSRTWSLSAVTLFLCAPLLTLSHLVYFVVQ